MSIKKHASKKLNDLQIDQLYCRNLDIANRVLYFMPWHPNEEMIDEYKIWGVNDFSIQSLLKGLYILNSIEIAPITIRWMAEGGDWDSGISAFDYMKYIKSPITMECYGRVRSMGTVILQACETRLLSKHCLFMIHYGSAAFEGTTQDFTRFSEKCLTPCNEQMEDIYLERIREKKPRFSRDRLKAELEHDNYMTPMQAIELGLADGII